MNKWILSETERIEGNFIEYSKSNINRSIAEALVNKGITLETLGSNENLAEMYTTSLEVSPNIPLFKEENSKPILLSTKFFEMMRLAFSYSSFLNGLDQYVAARKIEESKQHQFTVFAYYSSAFHLITSFLSIHGHMFLPKIVQEVEVSTVEKREESEIVIFHSEWNKFVYARYFDNKVGWTFRYCGLNHNERWKLFTEVLKKYLKNNWEDQIPKGVTEFWGQMKVQEEYPQHMYKDEWRYSIEFIDKKDYIRKLGRLYKLPAKIRHQKIYENRRWGLFSSAYLNKDVKPPQDIEEIEITIFRYFCESMINWMYDIHSNILEILENNLSNKIFYKALNRITNNPSLQITKYSVNYLMNEPILKELNKKIPLLIELILT